MKTQQLSETETITIENLSHDGRGIARVDGKTTFIQGALPDETVQFKYLRRKKSFDEGVALSILKPSPNRVPPICPHFGICGGCSLQHLSSALQIHEKEALFIDMLQRIGHCTPETRLEPLEGPLQHYRHKARLSVRYSEKTGRVFLGFREKNSPRYIADITQCPILHLKIDEQLIALRDRIAALDSPASIAQVEIAVGDDEVALVFRHLSPLSKRDEMQLIELAQKTHFRIYLQSGGPDTVTLFYPKEANEFLIYRLPSENIAFSFFPTDFIQINAAINRLMVPRAIQLLELDEKDTVLDLYCGLGNFSLPMARHCQKVIGVEGSDRMVHRAQMNAVQNGVSNVHFMSANLEDASVMNVLSEYRVTKLLLDPPRVGAVEIVSQIDRIRPERLVYVSCNPATLARDAGILVNEKGYRLSQAGVMDMFPHTDHVESIAVFER